MKKKKEVLPPKLTCSCCQTTVTDSEITQTLHRLVDTWGGLQPVKREYLERGIYQWACDQCLKKKRAIKGDFTEQVFCDYNPYLAYYDINKKCTDCQEDYVFEAKEQQYWYEVLKFWVQSEPKHCPSCRKKRRAKNLLNKELSEILKDKKDLTLEELERLATIYEQIGKPERANYFRNRAKKIQDKD